MPYTFNDLYNDQAKYLASQSSTKSRLVELNEGYRKRYAKYVEIISVVVLAVLLYLAVNLLQRNVPGISNGLIDTLLVLLTVAVAVYLMMAIAELNSRSVINYDELNIPSATDSSGAQATTGKNGRLMPSSCTTADCCSELGAGYTWNETMGACVQCSAAACCGAGTHWGGSSSCIPDTSRTCDPNFTYTPSTSGNVTTYSCVASTQ